MPVSDDVSKPSFGTRDRVGVGREREQREASGRVGGNGRRLRGLTRDDARAGDRAPPSCLTQLPVIEPVVPARAGRLLAQTNASANVRAMKSDVSEGVASARLSRPASVSLPPEKRGVNGAGGRTLRRHECGGRTAYRSGAARHGDFVPGLASRSRAAHADEQPRSGGSRTPRRSRRLRRQRPRGALVGARSMRSCARFGV